jgi:hypothetical protein
MPYKDPEMRRANRRAYYRENTEKVAAQNNKSRLKNIDKVRAHDVVRGKTPERLKMHRVLNHNRWAALPEGEKQRLSAIRLNRKIRRQEATAGRHRPDICDLCGEAGRNGAGMYFDHCHRNNHFRGWICWRCNITLGHVGDNVGLLRKMIAYLERHKENTSPQLALSGV